MVMEVLQNNHFLSCDLLISITYFCAKMQGNFFWCIFLQFWNFLLFVTILGRDHIEFFQIYLKEHISTLEIILSFGHQVILPLKHCIHRKNLNFAQLYLLVPIRSHDHLNQMGFQNIYFLSCGLLGISVYFNNKVLENCIFSDFKAWPLAVPMRSHAFFYFFHYTSISRTQKL